jgi:hypothetical protein
MIAMSLLLFLPYVKQQAASLELTGAPMFDAAADGVGS